MNLNKVFIAGRVTADVQLRTTPTGAQVSSFGVATNRVWTDKGGNKQEEVEFHNVVVWGRQAEIASQFLTKGSLVLIEGRLRTRTWQDKQGQNRRTTEIICERMQLGPKPAGHGGSAGSPQSGSTGSPQGSYGFKNENYSPPAQEAVPEINIEEGEIKAEDLPF